MELGFKPQRLYATKKGEFKTHLRNMSWQAGSRPPMAGIKNSTQDCTVANYYQKPSVRSQMQTICPQEADRV